MLVLAIESSTSSAKAILYDTEKGIVKSDQRIYEKEIEGEGETNAEGVFQLSMDIARSIAQGEKIEALSLCGTWHGLCACDEEMKPVTPVYSWNFVKTADICNALRKDEELKRTIYHNTGCMLHVTYPRHGIQYMAQEGLDITDKYFVTQGGYNFYQITGEFLESVTTQSGSGIINLKERKYDAYTLDLLGIREDQLGRVVDYKETRPLNAYGAKLLGLTEGIPVVPAHPDGALNQIGNYASHPGMMTISIGTSGALRMVTKMPVLPEGNQLWCYCGVEEWISGAAIAGACNCIDWYRNKIGRGELSFEELEETSDEYPSVPVFLPFLYGERCPGWNDARRGGFMALDEFHGVPELYQGIQMGILFNSYQCYEVLCKENGAPNQIIVSGGITNSKGWTQMLADIFQKEILVSSYPNASSMGAIALALHACGQLEDIKEFRVDYNSAITIKPREEAFDYYRGYYEKYLEAYHLK